MPSVSVTSVITDSLLELGRIQVGDTVPANIGEFCLSRLNQIVDNWNAQREAVYSEVFLEFTFVPNQQVYSIGPTGDFTTDIRPVSIEGGNVVLSTNPPVYNPINTRDYQWWMRNSVRQVSTTYPTDVYYQPFWPPSAPNGQLNFYPIPTTTYGCELVARSLLPAFTLNGQLDMPPGYQNAIMLTLAEDIASGVASVLSPLTRSKAREARARAFSNNRFIPSIATQDYGMPSTNRNRTTWNYLSGLDVNVSR